MKGGILREGGGEGSDIEGGEGGILREGKVKGRDFEGGGR